MAIPMHFIVNKRLLYCSSFEIPTGFHIHDHFGKNDRLVILGRIK